MIEFIGNNIRDISYWLMFLAMVGAYILLHYQKKANRNLAEMARATLEDSLKTETKYNKVICVVTGFVRSHNEWHDRKIKFYYDQDGWHCCYDDEIPQGDTFIEQEEITPQNENKDENQG